MADYSWPARDKAQLIGKHHERLDGMVKATGAAKYAYDVNHDNQLIVRALGCPHAHCHVKSVDATAAMQVPGVVHVHILRGPKKPGDNAVEIECQGELIAAVAAETEGAAAEGVSKLKVDYEVLDTFTDAENLEAAEQAGRTTGGGAQVDLVNEPSDDEDEDEFEEKEIQRLLRESKHAVDGYYGIDAITHCCLEPHGSTVQWKNGRLEAYLSTQNVSATDDQFAAGLGITADEVDVYCEYIGGGFGSKFAADYWDVAGAEIAKATGRPVKFLLTRDQELKIGGNRPSGYVKVRIGADEDGVVQVWDSQQWGTSGHNGGGVSPNVMPYVYRPQNYRRRATSIVSNTSPARAWRAPNHPQACAISQTAYDDLAAKMGANSYDIFLRNLDNISSGQKADVYREELKIAADLMDWNAKWHPHGKGAKNGSMVEGLGIGLHTWGGTANSSNCRLRIHPDGGVESYCGTQDLGTGTRTVCALVLAETLGLPIEGVKVHIGSSKYPLSGASGGSTTVGAVSESHRRAGQDALRKMFDLVAPKLEVQADALEAVAGRIQVKGNADKSLSWKEACRVTGALEVTSSYERGTASPLSSEGVGGVQMAHVAVDTATGVVRMKKLVAVQDMGLIINRKTAESQIYGAVIMAIAYSLFEQRITDANGAFVNAEMANYKLPRLGDIGEIVINLYEPEDQRSRGVIGLGEPPVISGGAAISNAVCNALGVRVPVLPLTPKRVLGRGSESIGVAMKNFAYAQPRTEAEVLEVLSSQPGHVELLAGGTDLVGLMKKMVVTPDCVVNVAEVDSMRHIEPMATGDVVVGASVRLDEFLDSVLTDAYPAIKQAIQGINSSQLQAQGTIGGELLRRPTCWYFRDGHGLLANRGRMVVDGDNRYHAILGNRGPAKFVNASRLAPALISLGASVRVVGPREYDERVLPLESLYQVPREDEKENVLAQGQIVTHVILPPDEGRLSAAYEVRQSEGPDQPLAAAAATMDVTGGIVEDARIVMGQVAPIPWMSADAARSIIGQPITEQTAEIAGIEAVAGAMPLSQNNYKVQLAQVAVQRAILRAAGLDTGGF